MATSSTPVIGMSAGTPQSTDLVYGVRPKGTSVAVTNVQLTSNVATLTTATNTFVVNQYVTVTGLTNTQFNGTWQLTGATSTSITFALVSGNVSSTSDSGLAWTAADLSFTVSSLFANAQLITQYNGVNTAGTGVPAIYASARSTGRTAAVASVAAYTNAAADGSFEVSANVNVTASATNSFTVTCTYTDETNTSRTATFSFVQAGVAAPIQTITNVTGVGAYAGIPMRIRAKASTTITIATTGTFTSLTYNVEADIKQVA
jgi:hypothetical protein